VCAVMNARVLTPRSYLVSYLLNCRSLDGSSNLPYLRNGFSCKLDKSTL
jgi:hypothetical protein